MLPNAAVLHVIPRHVGRIPLDGVYAWTCMTRWLGQPGVEWPGHDVIFVSRRPHPYEPYGRREKLVWHRASEAIGMEQEGRPILVGTQCVSTRGVVSSHLYPYRRLPRYATFVRTRRRGGALEFFFRARTGEGERSRFFSSVSSSKKRLQ